MENAVETTWGLTLGKLRQELHEFKVSLSYIANFKVSLG